MGEYLWDGPPSTPLGEEDDAYWAQNRPARRAA
jgi:hypothetical protein